MRKTYDAFPEAAETTGAGENALSLFRTEDVDCREAEKTPGAFERLIYHFDLRRAFQYHLESVLGMVLDCSLQLHLSPVEVLG